MNIINENEKIDLILTMSLLNKSKDIKYNSKYKDIILINNYILQYNSIKLDNDLINNNSLTDTLIKYLLNKNDATLLILTDSNKDSKIYLTSLQNILNKNNYKQYNIISISFEYSYNNENNKSHKIYDLLEIGNIDNNLFIKIKIEYNNDIIYSYLKILILNNSYEKICPLFCLNRKEYELTMIKDKINSLLLEEKKLENNIKKLPLLNVDIIEEINSYKNEAFDYFSKFVNNIEKMNNKLNNIKSLTKNDLNSFIQEINNFFDKINKEKFINKQNEIYKQYINIYKNYNNVNITKQNEDNLKSLFLKFININEEILNFLERNDINKKEIINLKNVIKFLQNEIRQEKSRNISNIKNNLYDNYFKTVYIDNNVPISNHNTINKNRSKKKIFNKSFVLRNNSSGKKYHRIQKRNVSLDDSSYKNNKTFEENNNENKDNYLNKKISQLNDIISNLKSSNKNLEKSNEKMKHDIKNLNKIIAKLHRINEENHFTTEIISKSSSIKSFKPKILATKEKKLFSGQKIHDSHKNLYLNNDINNENENPEKKTIKIEDNSSSYKERDYILLKKIHDENKNMSKIINNYYFSNHKLNSSSMNFNINNINKTTINHTINSSTSKKVKNKNILYNKMKLHVFPSTKVHKKSSVPKIKFFKSNYYK